MPVEGSFLPGSSGVGVVIARFGNDLRRGTIFLVDSNSGVTAEHVVYDKNTDKIADEIYAYFPESDTEKYYPVRWAQFPSSDDGSEALVLTFKEKIGNKYGFLTPSPTNHSGRVYSLGYTSTGGDKIFTGSGGIKSKTDYNTYITDYDISIGPGASGGPIIALINGQYSAIGGIVSGNPAQGLGEFYAFTGIWQDFSEAISNDDYLGVDTITGISTSSGTSRITLENPININGTFFSTGLIGTLQDDYLTGSNDPDLLIGNNGNDQLEGGHGADVFTFAVKNQFGKSDSDSIVDFNSTEDFIGISQDAFKGLKKIRFKSFKNQRQKEKLIMSKSNIIYDRKNGLLFYNENGTGKGYGKGGEFSEIINSPTLAKSSFVLIDTLSI